MRSGISNKIRIFDNAHCDTTDTILLNQSRDYGSVMSQWTLSKIRIDHLQCSGNVDLAQISALCIWKNKKRKTILYYNYDLGHELILSQFYVIVIVTINQRQYKLW